MPSTMILSVQDQRLWDLGRRVLSRTWGGVEEFGKSRHGGTGHWSLNDSVQSSIGHQTDMRLSLSIIHSFRKPSALVNGDAGEGKGVSGSRSSRTRPKS